MKTQQRLSLNLGPRGRCLLTGLPADLHLAGEYDAFVRSESEIGDPDIVLRFFENPEEPDSWRSGEEVFSCESWNLRHNGASRYVVGTAFTPTQAFWVAEANSSLTDFSISHLETSPRAPEGVVVDAALRILARLSLMRNLAESGSGLLVHTAAAVVDGRIILFPGVSGAGKSTFSRLLLDRPSLTMVNDDRVIVARGGDGEWYGWGTPWPGELGIALSRHAPLGGILFLEKSARSRVEPIGPSAALERLLKVVSVPWYDERLAPAALEVCGRIISEAPTAVLHCRPDESAVEVMMESVARGIDGAP